jgi:hypothetical protein
MDIKSSAGALVLVSAMFGLSTELRAGDAIIVLSCPTRGVEMNCLIVRTPDGVTYDISSARPRPRTDDLIIRLSGTKTDKLGFCQQGVKLDHIKWTYTKRKCRVR